MADPRVQQGRCWLRHVWKFVGSTGGWVYPSYRWRCSRCGREKITNEFC